MKAWIVENTKAEKPLRGGEAPAPEPAPGRTLIRVEAAALNFSDLLMVRGRYQIRPPLPFTPGQEVAGTVIAAAPGGRFAPGQRLASKVVWGGFAEQALVDDAMAIAVPEGMSLAEAAALPVVYTTAHIALLEHGRLRAGETVLVHAAAGGVGLAAVEIAAAKGARVIATVGGSAKAPIPKARGAAAVLDYDREGWADEVKALTGGNGADVIFDSVGGAVTEQSLRCLAWRGRLLVVGFSSGTIPALPANRLLLRNASAIGVYWSHEHDAALIEATVRDLFALHAAGKIRPLVDTRWRLDELPAALAALQSRQSAGKIVLRAGDAA
ncbi:MAG: NADPH:quinone oxidoreductase family protein [Rhodospirillaceae bacterium]|nr:NADPH:quinone oxidoreductase family protein [Rhodospirillaceae bacterium]